MRAPSAGAVRPVQLHCASVETWRCPHCGTPQTDGARCWACSRHPFACGTCRNYVRAVAGRLGYCALDRTRAVLQGDEVRACWQASSRPEPFEGLFRGLDPEPPAIAADASGAATGAHATTATATWAGSGGVRERDPVATRTWAIPVTGEGTRAEGARAVGVMAGLREATFVPARGIARSAPSGPPGSVDREVLGAGERPPVGEGDPDGHQAIPGRDVLHDPEA